MECVGCGCGFGGIDDDDDDDDDDAAFLFPAAHAISLLGLNAARGAGLERDDLHVVLGRRREHSPEAREAHCPEVDGEHDRVEAARLAEGHGLRLVVRGEAHGPHHPRVARLQHLHGAPAPGPAPRPRRS